MNALDRFKAEYHSYHQISPARSREQINVLTDLAASAGVDVLDVTDEHVRTYLSGLIAAGEHPNTVRKKRSMIFPFYGWAFDARLVDAERLMRIQRIPAPRGSSNRSTPNPYSRKEVAQFWSDLDASWPIRQHYVDRWMQGRSRWVRAASTFMHSQINAITHLALHAGMRRDEIFNAPLNDIHYDNAYVVVKFGAAKNRQGQTQEREVPMTGALSAALEEWLELRAFLKPGHDRPWLSLTPYGPRGSRIHLAPMSHDRIEELLGTVGSGYELHRFRHTCATEWLRAGVPIEKVQILLGHARIDQTLAYAKIIRQDLEKSMAKVETDFSTAVGRRAA